MAWLFPYSMKNLEPQMKGMKKIKIGFIPFILFICG